MQGMRHPEDDECKVLWAWAQHVPVLRAHLYHVPNGGRRNLREAVRLRGMGVRPGVHDYHLPVPRGTYCGLWIEMKAGNNAATKEQREWRDLMRAAGHAAFIVYGAGAARKVFKWYLALPVMPADVWEHPQEFDGDKNIKR